MFLQLQEERFFFAAFKKVKLFLIMCIHVCLCVILNMRVPVSSEARGKESPRSALRTWALGPEFGSYGASAHTLSRWDISPAAFVHFCLCLFWVLLLPPLLTSIGSFFFLRVQCHHMVPPASRSQWLALSAELDSDGGFWLASVWIGSRSLPGCSFQVN